MSRSIEKGPTNPIDVKGIDHVVIRVDSLEKMIDFYTAVLGCELERGPGDMRLAQLRAGSALIDLVDANGPIGKEGGCSPDRNAPNMDHLCLRVDPWNVSAINAHLEANDIAPGEVMTRYGAEGSGPSMYIRDPEGNNIELKGPAHDQVP